jgi:hypothetical protein
MPRFLIEVPHEEEFVSCSHARNVFLETGSHFLTNADWGCKDGDHKVWLIAEFDSKEQARAILPAMYRTRAKIVQLNKFTIDEFDELLRYHRS